MSQFMFHSGPNGDLASQIQDIHGATQHMVRKMEMLILQQERSIKKLENQMDSFRDEVAQREMEMQLEIQRLRAIVEQRRPETTASLSSRAIPAVKKEFQPTLKKFSPSAPPGLVLFNSAKRRTSDGQARVAKTPRIEPDPLAIFPPEAAKLPLIQDVRSLSPVVTMSNEQEVAQGTDLDQGTPEPERGPQKVKLPCRSMEELALFMKDTKRLMTLEEELVKLDPILVYRNIFRKVLEDSLHHQVRMARSEQPTPSYSGSQKFFLPASFINWCIAIYCGSHVNDAMPEHMARQKLQNYLYERRKTYKKKVSAEFQKQYRNAENLDLDMKIPVE